MILLSFFLLLASLGGKLQAGCEGEQQHADTDSNTAAYPAALQKVDPGGVILMTLVVES